MALIDTAISAFAGTAIKSIFSGDDSGTSNVGLGNVASGYIGSQAALDAANIQAGAAQRATDAQTGMYQQTRGDLSPYMQGGNVALSSMLGKMGDGSLGGQFTHQDYLNNQDPGYEFQRQQGEQALQNSQAAHDGVLSGSALKGLINYNQGAASTGYQSAYERWLKSQQNTFGQLKDTATIGENAAAGSGTIGANYAQGISGTITGQGNALGAGRIGSANGMGSAINGGAVALSGLAGKIGNALGGDSSVSSGYYGNLQGGFQNDVQGATGDFARLDRSNYNAY